MFSEDLAVFINDDTPDYQLFTINGLPVGGLFGKEFIETNFVESSVPVLSVQSADIVGIAHGDAAISAASVNYKVVGIRPDGGGITTLILESQ